MFSTLSNTAIVICGLRTLSIWTCLKILSYGKGLTLNHTIPSFNDLWRRRLLKTFWEKEKMLVTSIFSFFQNVFYSSKSKFQFLSQIMSSASTMNLDHSKIFSFGTGLISLLIKEFFLVTAALLSQSSIDITFCVTDCLSYMHQR